MNIQCFYGRCLNFELHQYVGCYILYYNYVYIFIYSDENMFFFGAKKYVFYIIIKLYLMNKSKKSSLKTFLEL